MMMVFFCFWVVRFDFNKILNAFTDLILENIDDIKTDVLELTPLIQWKILLLYLYSVSTYCNLYSASSYCIYIQKVITEFNISSSS